jgi:hypothetical protein
MNGRTNIRKVTKLDTGLPGKPIKKACCTSPNASGLPGLTAICHIQLALRFHGRLDVVFLADRHAARGDNQVVPCADSRSTARVAASVSGTMPKSLISQPRFSSRRAA